MNAEPSSPIISREEIEQRALAALWPLRPNDASTAWLEDRPEFYRNPDGKRWDVRLGQVWSSQGRGVRALREALGPAFGSELGEWFDDMRFAYDGAEQLRTAGEERTLGPAIYTSADLEVATHAGDIVRYSLLTTTGTSVRTIRSLEVLTKRGDVIINARPNTVDDAVVRFHDTITEPPLVEVIAASEIRALAPIIPQLEIGVRRVHRAPDGSEDRRRR